MSRKKKPKIVVDKNGLRWNPEDFDLDSHGVQAPEDEVFEMMAELGRKPEDLNEEVRERYRHYLERLERKGKP